LAEQVTVVVNGTPVAVPPGTTVAAAVALHGVACRRSVTGEMRGPLCGIGVCFECRVEIDGRPHCRSCQILCAAGMKVRTDG
jgi:predicted molibdopterin-dependent oxidoreductase YjgC